MGTPEDLAARREALLAAVPPVTAAADASSTGTVIVAVPADDDPIWGVSSEPKPHMTMIWLGKGVAPEDLDAIRSAVAGAAEEFAHYEGPQELTVTSREPLGDDEADVLMLNALRGPMERLRDYMASHDVIARVMATAEQYPQWTPHLTVGYPDAPATGEPGSTIRFDRLALWTGEYEGDEFPLTQSVTADATSNQWQHRDQHGRWLEMSTEAKRLGAGGSLSKAPQIVGDRTDRVKVPQALGTEAPLQMTRVSAGEYLTADGEYALSLVEGTTWRILLAKIRQRLAGSLDYPSYEDARTALAAMLRRGPAGLREANQTIMADIRAAGRDARKQALLAAVRHVRTPEGEKKYGQPIGSIITADRDVKAHIPTTAKWRDLKPGDRFINGNGETMEVISREPYNPEAERRAIEDFYAEHYEEYQSALVRVPRPPKASGKVLPPAKAFSRLVGMDSDIATKVHDEWLAKHRKMVTLYLDGPMAGRWGVSDGVSNPDHEFTLAGSVTDTFEEEIVVPARVAMQTLVEKYPNGIAPALSRALHMAPPEPVLSDEFKRLLALPEVQKWRQRDLPNARTRLADLEAEGERLSHMGGNATAVVKNWDAQLAARREFLALLPKGAQPPWRWPNEGEVGTLDGVFAEVTRLEEAHQDEYAVWLRTKNDLTPTSPEALTILADVEAVGAIVREGVERGIVRAEAEQHWPQTGKEYERTREGARRHLTRRAVAALRGHAETTKQKWLTDFDMTKLGAERGLHPEEKDMLTESLLFYPESWVEGFDRLGQVTTDKSTRGYFGTEGTHRKQHHISLSDAHNAGVYEGSDMQTTAVHEVGHGMERVIPGLTALEMIFWYQRTGKGRDVLLEAFDEAESPRHVLHPTGRDYTLKYYGKTVKGRAVNPTAQRMYRSPDMTVMPESWEVFTTGVQEVLGNGWTDYTVREGRYSGGAKDTELWDLTMGALLSLPGGLGQPLFSNGTMKVEEVQPTMAPKMITDQELITAAHPSTRSKRYYRALYSQGDQVTFAVNTATMAQRYAREYGIRFLGGQTPVSVKWAREEM